MISVQKLGKRFNGVHALDGFDLEVREGEAVGLVGPNGAGKTTLLRTLATLLKPTAGSASIAGHDVRYEREKVRALIGYLPDIPGLYQQMQVGEFLEFFAEAFHVPKAQRAAAVELALERAGLQERRDAFVEQLSFGMKQRLVLAKTLLHSPRVLLLDEPATGLDPLARLELRDQLKRLHAAGITLVVSSHILADLEDICTRVVLIAQGRNAGETVMAAAAAPVTRCEIEFLGAPEAAEAAVRAFGADAVLASLGPPMLVEISGGAPRAAALLRHLVATGVDVVRFDPGGQRLEHHYREVFGGRKP